MQELVIMQNQQAVTSSLNVAETFEKRHDHILRDISAFKKDVPNFGEMFEEGNEPDSYGRNRRIYFMNRDGFTLLAMGFTGKKAMEFKLKYINAFNQMEKTIKAKQIADNPDLLIARGYKAAIEKTKALELENKQMKPKALFADSVATSKATITVGQLAKILQGNNVNIGPYKLFKWLRNHEYLIKRPGKQWNMPTAKSMRLKLFKVSERTNNNSDGSVSMTYTPMVTGEGQIYFVNKLVNGEQLKLV